LTGGVVGEATMADHLSWMQHEATTSTKTHDDEWWGASRYREPAAKARAEAVSGEIIGAAIEVHRQLGPGLLEKGLAVEAGHRIDLLVEDLVIVELKSVERLEPVHQFQLLTYLRLSGRWMGLLVNFDTDLIEHGLRRMLNG
jgi:hypothetical protein